MKIQPITQELLPKLEIFCKHAEELGYINNASLKAMKYEWCNDFGGKYFCAIKDDNIIAVAGCHPLPEVGENAWRILFRGCELPHTDTFKGLGRVIGIVLHSANLFLNLLNGVHQMNYTLQPI